MNICPKCQGFRGFVNDSQGRKPCLCDLEAQLSASNEDADKWCKLANERWNQIASMETRLASWRELFGAKEGESPEQCRAIWQEALNEQDRLRAQLAQLKAPSPGEQQRRGGVSLITAERARQIAVEGWSAGHDDEHYEGEMAKAAACYALGSNEHWPWGFEWWKPVPGNRVRELVKAGALIAAEIDRLNRLPIPQDPCGANGRSISESHTP